MLNLTLSLEEFTAKRRGAQDEFIERLKPAVVAALAELEQGNEQWFDVLDTEIDHLYNEAYKAEGGEVAQPATGDLYKTLDRVFDKTQADSDPDVIATWLAIAIINIAAMQAAQDDPEDIFMEWVTMEDDAVRVEHKRTEGQTRPLGEPFNVDGVPMDFPGDSRAPIELWINCRCTLRPRLASEFTTSVTASGGTMDGAIPWHGVWAPEGVWSGDKRKFGEGSLTHRPLPLPLTWQKVSDDGHKGNVVVAMAEDLQMIDGMMHASGHFISNAEADEVVGLLGEFGRFGVSVDADDAVFELDEEEEGIVFTRARVASACIVPIPAFAEAWVSLGQAPWMKPKDEEEKEGEETQEAPQGDPVADEPDAVRDDAPPLDDEDEKKKVASALEEAMTEPISAIEQMRARATADWSDVEQASRRGYTETDGRTEFVDVAPGRTEDGPGWLTHPVDTDRLRDYWVRGPGAAKIGWGSPGDFNRCRVNVAEYIKPQHLNGYCANRHFDALGRWPGPKAHALDAEMEGLTDEAKQVALTASAAPALTIVAAAGALKAPAACFANPELTEVTPLTITDEGRVFGHLATWDACHIGFKDYCQAPPHSSANYSYFHTGAVPLDNGEMQPVGHITLGGGHADPMLGMQAALEHYDSTSAVVADVTVGEDTFGIWFSGWLRPGISDEMVYALQASALSGDWRSLTGRQEDLELIAALAVNVPGFGIPRTQVAASSKGQVALVAAGIVQPREQTLLAAPEVDVDALATAIFARINEMQANKERMAALAAKARKE